MKYFTPSVWSDYFVDFRLSQLTFVGWVIVLLSISSCDDSKVNRGLAPKLDDIPFSKKVVYLNKNTFKIVRRTGDNSDIILNNGIDEMLKIYSYLGNGNDLIKILEKHKTLFNNEFVDETFLKIALKEFESVKSRHVKAEGFVNFVNALDYACRILVVDAPIDHKKQTSISKEHTDNSDNSMLLGMLFWVLVVFLLGIFILFNSRANKLKLEKNLESNQERLKSSIARNVLNENKRNAVTHVEGTTLSNTMPKVIPTKSETEANERLKQQLEEAQQRIETENKQLELVTLLKRLRETKMQSIEEPQKTDSISLPIIKAEKVESVAIKPSTPEIAYFSLPMNERIFSNATRSTVPLIGATFYVFKISTDGKTATFDFWNNPDAVERAIDKAYSHIDAACEILNDRDLKATHIITEESGFAELQDNKWIVKTKAKIKYLL